MPGEKRGTYRYPVPNDEQSGILTLDQTNLPVRLVDQSMTGFTVRTQDKIRIAIGTVVVLVAGKTTLEVRVRSVVQEDRGSRLGLQRVRELHSAGQGGCELEQRGLRWLRDKILSGQLLKLISLSALTFLVRTTLDFSVKHVRKHMRKHASKWKVGTVMALAFIACGTMLLQLTRSSHQASSNLRLRGLLALAAGGMPESLAPTIRQQAEIRAVCSQTLTALNHLLEEDERDRTLENAFTQISEALTDEQLQRWKEIRAARHRAAASDRLPLREIVALAFGDTLEQLQATDEQQAQIRLVCEQFIDSLDFDWQSGAIGTATHATRFLNEADRRVSAVLTVEQQQRWELVRMDYNRGTLLVLRQ